jgi:hypothetical protein
MTLSVNGWSVFTHALTILLVAVPAALGQTSPLEQASKIRPGSKIEVVLLSGQQLKGRLGKVSEREFDLLPHNQGATSRVVSFAEVQRIRSKERRTGTRIAIYSAAIFGALVAFGGILTAAGCC